MLEKPIVAHPYGSVIDSSVDNEFSFIFTGDYLKRYEITIMDLLDNSVVYAPGTISTLSTEEDSGETSPTNPVYRGDEVRITVPADALENGKSYYWQVELGQDEFDVLITSGRTTKESSGSALYIGTGITTINTLYQRIKIGNTYYPITAYDSSTGYIQISGTVNVAAKTQYYIYSNTLKSTSFPFETRATPVVSISNIESPYSKRAISLTGAYLQSDGTHIRYHCWNMYNSAGKLIDTTGNLYHERLEYTFDGLVNGEIYYVEFIGETQDGVTFSSDRVVIDVQYDAPIMEAPPTVSVIDEKSAIRIDAGSFNQVIAVDNGTENLFSVIEGKACYKLNDGTLTCDVANNEIDKNDVYVQLKTKLSQGAIDDIIRLDFDDGSYMKVLFNGSEFQCNDNGIIRNLTSLFRSYTHCLTSDGISASGVCYRWDDSRAWDDT